MARKPYPSDLTDKQWEELGRLIPPARRGGRPRAVDMREVVNGILYVLRTGCAWRQMVFAVLENGLYPVSHGAEVCALGGGVDIEGRLDGIVGHHRVAGFPRDVAQAPQ